MPDVILFEFNSEPFVINVSEPPFSYPVICKDGEKQNRRIGAFPVTQSGTLVEYLFVHGFDSAPSSNEIKVAIQNLKPRPYTK